MEGSQEFLCQLNNSLQLCGAAVQVGSGGLDVAVTCQRLEQMNSGAFVGKVCEERPAATVAAGTLNAR